MLLQATITNSYQPQQFYAEISADFPCSFQYAAYEVIQWNSPKVRRQVWKEQTRFLEKRKRLEAERLARQNGVL